MFLLEEHPNCLYHPWIVYIRIWAHQIPWPVFASLQVVLLQLTNSSNEFSRLIKCSDGVSIVMNLHYYLYYELNAISDMEPWPRSNFKHNICHWIRNVVSTMWKAKCCTNPGHSKWTFYTTRLAGNSSGRKDNEAVCQWGCSVKHKTTRCC